MTGPSVAIRVDSGVPMGSGHLMRCLNLANEMQRQGARVQFIGREHPEHLLSLAEQAGHAVHRLPAPAPGRTDMSDPSSWLGVASDDDADQTRDALAESGCDSLVIDHYAIDANWERKLRLCAKRLIVIDDLANRPHDADVLLDQNFVGAATATRYDALVPASCLKLLGARYALLQPIYSQLRPLVPPRDGVINRVLLFFGAHDPSRATLSVLRVLSEPEFTPLQIDVVAAGNAEVRAAVVEFAQKRGRVTIHQGLPSLAGLMVRADLAIGAGGVTTWERACLGLPALVATIADNQTEGTKAVAAVGAVAFLGRSAQVTDAQWREALRSLRADPASVADIGLRASALVDGLGVARAAIAMVGRRVSAVSIRKAVASDEALLLDWSNDPSVRSMAFSKESIVPEAHHRWFSARLANPACMILIGEGAGGVPLGQVRFDSDVSQRRAIVSISVDRAMRGLGVGQRLLDEALRFWRARMPGFTAVAEVLLENDSSRRLFELAGFQPVASLRADSHTFELRQ